MKTFRFIIYCCAYLILIGFKYVWSLRGDVCTFRGATGICVEGSKCVVLKNAFKNNQIISDDIVSCGTTIQEELVCCPNDDIFRSRSVLAPSVIESQKPTTILKSPSVRTNLITERPSERACREYYTGGLSFPTHTYILSGAEVKLGEYPHMAAIGFSEIGGNRNALVYNCGGTLIHERFILTAAHCLANRNLKAEVVRLGVTNFFDPVQMASVVEKIIVRQHIHPDYIISKVYNDIALLELQSPVKFTETIFPTCLYTQEETPNRTLHATAWGESKSSYQLLKASLTLQPVDACNATYTSDNTPDAIGRDLLKSLLCSSGTPGGTNVCQGDSGGPLIMDVDISRAQYQVVGVVSTRFDCGMQTPTMYTSVSSFLNFIESVVWPST